MCGASDCRLPASALKWRTFYPLVDTIDQAGAGPSRCEVHDDRPMSGVGSKSTGSFPISRKSSRSALSRPALPDSRSALRIGHEFESRRSGNRPASRPRLVGRCAPSGGAHAAGYRRYIRNATAEFTAIKGVDVAWRTGWLSDRAAAFLPPDDPSSLKILGGKVSAG
jgi:hypothetical protein